MKQIDISDDCYAHLMGSSIYLYVHNQFCQMLYIDNIENEENPVPLIKREIELASRDSLYECSLSF